MDDFLTSIESKVDDRLGELLKVDAIQDALCNLLVTPSAEKEAAKLASVCTEIQKIILDNSTGESPANSDSSAQKSQDGSKPFNAEINLRIQEVVIKCIASKLAKTNNNAQAQILVSVFVQLSGANALASKLLCTNLLLNENLKPDSVCFWMSSFQLVKRIIPTVDYKGVREIMKCCLQRAQLLPTYLQHSQLKQVDALCQVMDLIFDRSSSLLPGYFIVNELLKLYPENMTWPHWRVSKLLSDFIQNFRRAAQMLSVSGRTKFRPLVEPLVLGNPSNLSWKLDSGNLKFPLRGSLPYSKDLQAPQIELLYYVLRQPLSKDFIAGMLDLQKKQRYLLLEEHLAKFLLSCLQECSQIEVKSSHGNYVSCRCLHYLYLLLSFITNQQISFPGFIQILYNELCVRNSRVGRDHLMWVLLHYTSTMISKSAFSEYHPILKIIEFLYPDAEPLPTPDFTEPYCAIRLSAICILFVILRKAQAENMKIPHSLPTPFTKHHELIQSLGHNQQLSALISNIYASPLDFRSAVLFNAYSTNNEIFQRSLHALTEAIQGNPKSTIPMPGNNCFAINSTTPLPLILLDSLTLHVKMLIFQSIYAYIMKQAHSKLNIALAPGLLETFARFMVYTETEQFNIRPIICNILPAVLKCQSWGIVHALLEMFNHRIHHFSQQYRMQLLSTINHVAAVNLAPQLTQFHLSMENIALSLINGMPNSETIFSVSKIFPPDSKPNIISAESEELNRVLVLTIARVIHITGCESLNETSKFCVDFIKVVMNHTPHTWASSTLQCFPKVLVELYEQHGSSRGVPNLKKAVEEEYRKWKSMNNENDIIAYFSLQHNTPPLFLCLLFKMVLEMDRVPVEAFKVLERISHRQLMAHVRTLCDFLVLEFSNLNVNQEPQKYIGTINAIIWQYNIVSIDCLMLCLALRTQEANNELQICLLLITLILRMGPEFRNRVQDFVSKNSPEHWKQNNWYESHMNFHRKYPEKFACENLLVSQGSLPVNQSLPVYFTNVCLRMLPVMDIIIHRFIEVQKAHKHLGRVLDQLGVLYKFHKQPITYLYNTLHYYEECLSENSNLKRQLVSVIVSSQNDIRPANWALTEEYVKFMCHSEDNWVPSLMYYMNLVRRLVHTIQGKEVFPISEWRFNEFVTAAVHAIHVTCVEIMALPVPPSTVGTMLFNAVIKGFSEIPKEELAEWANAVGLIFTWLPEAYWLVVHKHILQLLQHHDFKVPGCLPVNPFTMLNLKEIVPSGSNPWAALSLAIIHAFWHHSSFKQLSRIPLLMNEQIRPLLESEEQLVLLFHLVGPFLQRISQESQQKLLEITTHFYEAIGKVDQKVQQLKYQDAICDVLYHIKYMFTGDSIKQELSQIIRNFRPSLQLRLRFIAHLNVGVIESGVAGTNIQTSTSNASGDFGASNVPAGAGVPIQAAPSREVELSTPVNVAMAGPSRAT